VKGREGGRREGGKEEEERGREGKREGRREGGREGGSEGIRNGSMQEWRMRIAFASVMSPSIDLATLMLRCET
jgi:hypothetical protein